MKSAMAVPNSAVGKGGSLIGVIMWNAVTATSHTNRIVRGFQTSIMICLKRGLAPTIISICPKSLCDRYPIGMFMMSR
jgi:hypothetical protein